MSVQVKRHRGSTTDISTYSGVLGEIVVNTTSWRAVVMDGSLAGGYPLALLSEVVTSGGAAGGDLSGTYPNPTVAKINGVALGSTTATAGNLLIGSGSTWVSHAVGGDVTINSSGTVTIANNAVTDAKFRQGVARSVVGVTGNATANTADIQGIANQVLRINSAGTALAFGAIDLSQLAAATGVLQAASFPAQTGDVTNSAGSLATTVGKINGVTLGSTTATAGNLLVGSGSQWVSVAVSGDIAINSSGVTAIGSGKVTNAMLAGSIAWSKLLGTDITAITITSASANALAVGLNGSTNPAFQVDASAASSATGIKIKSAAAAGGVAISVLSSGADESLTVDAKGAGTIKFGSVSTGAILFSRNANPTSSDGAALGTTSLMWSDLFLASGGVINFANGDATITHSLGVLSVNTTVISTRNIIVNAAQSYAQYAAAAGGTTGFAVGRSLGGGDAHDFFIYDLTNSAARITITGAGVVAMPHYGAGTATFDASGNISSVSDARLKTRLGDFTRSLIDLRKVGPASNFRWNEDSGLSGESTGWLLTSGKGMVEAIPESIGVDSKGFYTFADRPVLAAVVNSILELDDRLTALEN